ncbi:MAG: DUF512 domain-containing protein [Clostridium sp.]|uniref:DUF512 domain-containing protein n=1 Tax=Clostridium sp. TaxID=1506 RepID=UPI002A86BD35|nr:DUF512 domain-containing protein [Clostridium sp.]MDY5098104.1 DUF512 domain-containing protein [Clostridium sp.]
MSAKIKSICPGSIGDEVGLDVGDVILSINDNKITDIIDYRFLTSDDYLEIEVEKLNGEVWVYEIEKDYDEDLGIDFESGIMDKAKSCSNKCVFCFIDQLPKGMRNTLYFKDDDSRLSFLQGNFVTLTNMKDEDIDRIIKYRISPINISVHTTNSDIRKKMLNNRFAGNIYERLQRLAEAGIHMNTQIVVCPELNNGEELIKTVNDLRKLYPYINNVAAVPVGVTKYREGLYPLKTYDKETALWEIKNLENVQNQCIEKIGTPFIRLADEFYIMAGIDVPEDDFYGDYEQIEDGIGMIRYLRKTIDNTLDSLKDSLKGKITFVTGTSAYEEIKKVASKIENKNPKLNIQVEKIKNYFFGETITVAGLITAGDIINQLKDKNLGDYLVIPKNMLRANERVFLDDITVEELEKALKIKVILCSYTGDDLIEAINGIGEEE